MVMLTAWILSLEIVSPTLKINSHVRFMMGIHIMMGILLKIIPNSQEETQLCATHYDVYYTRTKLCFLLRTSHNHSPLTYLKLHSPRSPHEMTHTKSDQRHEIMFCGVIDGKNSIPLDVDVYIYI